MLETIFYSLIFFATFAFGIFVGCFISKRKNSFNDLVWQEKLDQQKNNFLSALQVKEDAWKTIQKNTEQAAQNAIQEKEKFLNASLSTQERSHKEAIALMQAKFDETVAKMQEEIKNLTSSLLKDQQREFQDSSCRQIDSILTPLNDSIERMRKSMEDNTKRQNEFSGVFSANVENILRQSEAARLSADRLTNALSKNSKIQGEWGETILTELLESQGLTEGIHFDTQAVFTSASSLRPDVILHLDNERDVIIDAKVSLSDFISFLNAETEGERASALKRHVSSIENHVKELIRKDYSSLITPPRSSIGYVIMFVPNTSALLLATNAKPDLWRKAMENNVYIADEQTLYAALKIVSLTWSRIAQNENHKEVYALANEMLDRVGKFMEKYAELGNKLESVSKAYTQGYDKLKEGGHSIPSTCRKLIKMGAKMERRKNVPDNLLGIDSSDSELKEIK
ncbi:MAG: DNA recombination protein RmuC [Muribaculaceae bacterium]|nr:DNA recombination protein RmuC [Muribaculaceae bacterium]